MDMEINLREYIGKEQIILCGREEGYKLREKLNLDILEETNYQLVIIIPEYICSMNSSYFIGLFKDSINKMNINGFKNKYTFKCSEYIKDNIKDGLVSLLHEVNN